MVELGKSDSFNTSGFLKSINIKPALHIKKMELFPALL
jgi:hypothetical protein